MTSPEDRRRWALERWVTLVSARWPVPDLAELVEVARANAVPVDASSALRSWGPTVEEILRQVRFGVVDPFPNLVEELQSPSVAAPPAEPERPTAEQEPEAEPEPIGDRSDEDALLAHLRARPEIAGIEGLRDMHLRLVVGSQKRTREELSSGLPPIVVRNAGVIADAIAAFGRPAAAPATEGPARSKHRARETSSAEPEPARQEAPGQAPSQPSAAPTGQLDGEGFEPFAFGASDVVPGEVRATVRDDGSVSLSWPASAVPAIDRVIAGDTDEPYSPDAARLVAVTRGDAALDLEPFASAVRHYQVWRNEGRDDGSAKRSQPVLVARAAIVAPVPDPHISEDSGRVVGRWQTVPGTASVHVYRVPRAAAAGGLGDPRFRLDLPSRNLNGFVDTTAERGAAYLYQVLAEAEVAGIPRLSQPRTVELRLSTPHEPVRDLEFSLHDADGMPYFDLHWTQPPGGSVVIYRTDTHPASGIDREPQHRSVLEQQAGLPESARLNQPMEVEDGRASMRGVPWPEGWTRAYFTAVVFQGDRVFVGSTIRGSSVPPPRNVKIVERVSRQLLTFDWPRGADAMQVFISRRGAASSDAIQGTPIEISREEYRDLGGFEPGPDPLPKDGCDLHLVSVLFDGGTRVRSAPVVATYNGMLRLRYTATVKRPLLGKQSVVVGIQSPELALDRAPNFVLVYNPDRLPLSWRDGEALQMVRNAEDPGTPSATIHPNGLGRPQDDAMTWRTEPDSWARIVRSGTGYVRLFTRLDPEAQRRVALLDPPLADLRLRPGVLR